jgi:hypothetical protein
VMSVPFVQQTPVGNMEPMSVMMAQMNQMMQTMSTFQSEVSTVLERRQNLQQTVFAPKTRTIQIHMRFHWGIMYWGSRLKSSNESIHTWMRCKCSSK